MRASRGLATLLAALLLSATHPAAEGVTTTNDAVARQDVGMPSLGVIYTDPAFNGTQLRRITDRYANSGWAAHIYSQLQAFSPSNEYVLLIEDGAYVVRRVSDLQLMPADLSDINAPRWQPGEDNTLVCYDSNGDETIGVLYIDVTTGAQTTHYTFPALYVRIRGNQSFDELSRDGRWMAGMASTSDGDQIMFSLDLEAKALGAQLRLSDLYSGGGTVYEPDWVGVSALGTYLVVQWVRDEMTRNSGMELFDIASGAFVEQVNTRHDHGDLGLDEYGNEIFVSTIMASPEDNNNPAIVKYRLPDQGGNPDLVLTVPWYTVSHISCQGPQGVYTVTAGPTGAVFNNEVFLLWSDGSVRRLTHHRSSDCGYWVQPRASMSADGRLVVFDSDYAEETGAPSSCTVNGSMGGGDVYLVLLSDSAATNPSGAAVGHVVPSVLHGAPATHVNPFGALTLHGRTVVTPAASGRYVGEGGPVLFCR